MTAGGHHPAIIANALGEAFGPFDIAIEEPEVKLAFLRRRARMTGYLSAAGQFITMSMIVVMKRLRRRHLQELVTNLGVHTDFDTSHRIRRLTSVNDPEFMDLIGQLSPDLVFLCGCRIVSPSVLRRLEVPVVNYHAGITPEYRGMNGGYWSLAEGDVGNFGATVHLVDSGLDTGAVLGQIKLTPQPGDAI